MIGDRFTRQNVIRGDGDTEYDEMRQGAKM